MNTTPIQPAFFDESLPEVFPLVDEWIPNEEDKIFKTVKGYIITDIADFYNLGDCPNNPLNFFSLSSKRSYNSPELREHCVHYLNYFEKFFDPDRELQMIYIRLKFLIDYVPDYSKESFIYDLRRYILNGPLFAKMGYMNKYNYKLNLVYKNKKNPVLQYKDKHAMILMKISLMMNAMIPLLVHFISTKKITNSTDFLLEVYDIILHMYDVDIYSKLYETSISNVLKNSESHSVLWGVQDIRGNNVTTHSLSCVNNIILNIIPKYNYSENIIHFNYRSILNNTGFQITDISYEYAFVSLSSSKRDAENNSEFDKFESFLTKTDESLYLQTKCECEDTMKAIEMRFGPFEQDELDFYIEQLSEDNRFVINPFQKELIFNLFYKYFGDPMAIKAINKYDYIKLMIASKRILEASGLTILPYIISGKVQRLVTRKNVNKKELVKLESSPFYAQIKDKYRSDKIEKQILSTIAVLLSSEFNIISYDMDEINGKRIECIPELVCEEVLLYISLI